MHIEYLTQRHLNNAWSNAMTTVRKLSFILAALLLFVSNESQARDFRFGVSFNYFYDRLTPHGDWLELDGGVTVWRPMHVSNRWSPYMRGSWVWTDCGWYWDSYENFGDIVYHYGRWYRDDYYGWIWVPDYQWAPAWVEWRYDDDYIGWAPLPPYAGFGNGRMHFSINFTIHFGHFHFVKYRHFGSSNIYNYYAADNYKYRIYQNTRVRNEYGYERDRVINRGVDRSFIERRGEVKVRERQISFRDDDNRRDNLARVNGDRIEISVPRERAEDATRKVDIRRGERNSSMDVGRIAVRAERNTGTESRASERKVTQDNNRTDARENTRKAENERIESRSRINTPAEPRPNVSPRTEVRPEGRPEVRPQVRTEEPRVESRRAPAVESRPQTQRELTRERSTSSERKTEGRPAAREERKETPRSNRER